MVAGTKANPCEPGGQPIHLREGKVPLSQRAACLVSGKVPSSESIQKQGLVNSSQETSD